MPPTSAQQGGPPSVGPSSWGGLGKGTGGVLRTAPSLQTLLGLPAAQGLATGHGGHRSLCTGRGQGRVAFQGFLIPSANP